MNCQQCKGKVYSPQVVYQRSVWIAHGEIWEGQPRGEKEIHEKGGVFCSDKCLIEFLTQEATNERDDKETG